MRDARACCCVALFLALPIASWTKTWRVGPDQQYGNPSDVARIAQDGDLVEIQSGNYLGDVSVWAQNGLTLRGLDNGAVLNANGNSAEGKGIWVIKGNDVSVDNIVFIGASVRDRNGAGIRHEGVNLTITNSRFEKNENGLLTGSATGRILIENSVFDGNGAGDGRSHAIYVGMVDRLTVRGSFFRSTRVAHHIKSRARETQVFCSAIMDGISGNSSYLVDIPNGGAAILAGNLLQQGRMSENRSLVSFSAENRNSRSGYLLILHNSFVNDSWGGTFVDIATPHANVKAKNNIFVGPGRLSSRKILSESNLFVPNAATGAKANSVFVDRERFDYRLAEGSDAIGAAATIDTASDIDSSQLCEYAYGAKSRARRWNGPPDLGAFEFFESEVDRP